MGAPPARPYLRLVSHDAALADLGMGQRIGTNKNCHGCFDTGTENLDLQVPFGMSLDLNDSELTGQVSCWRLQAAEPTEIAGMRHHRSNPAQSRSRKPTASVYHYK